MNLSVYTPTLIKQPDGSYRYLLNITFTDTVKIEEIRMKVNTVKGGKKTILWNVNVNKPCQHYMLAAMLETYFGVKNCWVKKGDIFVDMPLTELMVKYIGTSFFYGDYLFKVVVNSKKANLACLVFDPTFKKKK
ncbi:uncharacterized protein LOC123873460 [Maniola jurtina]|uniref:uncharacterized protein LOC123873460 n=1 Tax=Maniola jurtina TaxID=191418 RepID=UPI001E68E1EC|nr:uncharacterized protein LOC123873460 [Maniola jurtina]